jgi:arabinose-5-phosphate isomerase
MCPPLETRPEPSQQLSQQPSTPPRTQPKEAVLARARGIIDIEIQALEELKTQINGDFLKAVEIIEQAKGRVIVTGMGKSGLIGKKIAATLSSTGTPAYFLHPAEGSHGDLGLLTPHDVVLAISNSGETPEILNILPLVSRFGLPLIGMTGNTSSTLAQQSQAVLNIAVSEEACPLGLAPTASTTATLALGDALAVVLLERKGFTQDDFAIFHPAGALGKRLLLKVSDLMHTGDALPIVSTDTPFLEALVEMSSKKLGMTLVVEAPSGRMQGILTDGDVRRALTQWDNPKALSLPLIMTPSPKTITADALAVTALRIMEEHKITALVILNDTEQPVGVVHLHDILKTGIS